MQVSVEGVVASSKSDIAIDDVRFLENTVCHSTAETSSKHDEQKYKCFAIAEVFLRAIINTSDSL